MSANRMKIVADTETSGFYMQTRVETYKADIFCGFRPGYEKRYNPTLAYKKAISICQHYCNDAKLCVTIEKVEYIYVDGFETGIRVGIINYPRFPKSNEDIQKLAVDLAKLLKERFMQNRVTIVFPDMTIMIGEM